MKEFRGNRRASWEHLHAVFQQKKKIFLTDWENSCMSWFGYHPFISFSRFNSRRCVEPQIGQPFTEHTHSISCLLWKCNRSQTLSASFTRYTTSPEFSWLHISGSHVVHRADCRCSVYGIRYTVQHTVILAPYWLQRDAPQPSPPLEPPTSDSLLYYSVYYLTSRVPRPHGRSLASRWCGSQHASFSVWEAWNIAFNNKHFNQQYCTSMTAYY